MVERLNRSLKEAMQAIHLGESDWKDAVLTAVFSYRTCDHKATGKTSAELGRPLRTKLNAVHNLLSMRDTDVSNRIASYPTPERQPLCSPEHTFASKTGHPQRFTIAAHSTADRTHARPRDLSLGKWSNSQTTSTAHGSRAS